MKIVGQGARQRTDQIPAPILPELDVEDVDFQHVTRLGAGDRNRAGENMALQLPLAFRINLREFGRDVKLVFVRHHLGTAADGLDGDFVTAGDGQRGLQLRVEVAPVAGFGAGMQVMIGHEEGFLAREVVLHLSLPDLIRQSIFFEKASAQGDGYAGQARV